MTSVFATLGSIVTLYVPSRDMSENDVDPELEGPLARRAVGEGERACGAVICPSDSTPQALEATAMPYTMAAAIMRACLDIFMVTFPVGQHRPEGDLGTIPASLAGRLEGALACGNGPLPKQRQGQTAQLASIEVTLPEIPVLATQ